MKKEKYGTERTQGQLYIDKNVDWDKLFDFTKICLKDIFREMEFKRNDNGKIRIDIKMREVI